MGTGNSKKIKEKEEKYNKKEENEDKENTEDKEKRDEKEEKDKIDNDLVKPINVRINKRQTTNPIPIHSSLQPMRRYGHRQKTTIAHNKLNIDNNNNIDQGTSEHKKGYFRKSSEDYLIQFKQKYQTGETNAFLSHLAERVQSNELTQEEIEIIRKKYMPQYVIDWKLEKDEKTGNKFWKNQGKIKLTDDIMKDIKKLLKKPIGASEPFYKKRAWLFHYLSLNLGKIEDNSKLIIDKNNLFESSFQQFKKIKNIKVKLPMKILFLGEEDKDEGGVNKYWFLNLFKDIFSIEKKLFRKNNNESLGKNSFIFYPKYPGMNVEHYEFLGKLILKAFFDQITIKDFNLNNIVLNPIIKRKIRIEDIKYYDINLYKKLKSINDSKIKGNKDLEKYNFTWKIKDENNKVKEIELIENGKNILLNDDNKFQFIEKVIYKETIAPYEEQIKYFHQGIFPILDDNLKGIFTIDELNFLFHGQSDIDIKDWQENTDYKGEYNENHKVIKMFWDKIKKLKSEELSKFLEFSIGLSNIPIDGFGALKGIEKKIAKFTIEPYINYSDEDDSKYEFRPIESRPNFNRLILPEYPNNKEMDKAFDIILKK